MYLWYRIKRIFANIAAMRGRNSATRRLIRDRIMYHGIIRSFGQNTLPREKYEKRINVALCFDARGCKLAAVTIKSLLNASANRCDYDIYCVVDADLSDDDKRIVSDVVTGTQSRVIFLSANHDFDDAYRAGWSIGVWYRMMLPEILPNVDKIIYADIDIIFCRDLIDMDALDMGDNLLAGVKSYKNGYLNSGFLVMNLKEIRHRKMYDQWIKYAKIKKYKNPDQDLLNYTCRGKILYLPLKYNFQPRLGMRIFKVYDDMEISDLKYNIVVMHYANHIKPWNEPTRRPIYSGLWWDIAKQTGLY